MTPRIWIELGAAVVVLAILAILGTSWVNTRIAQEHMQAQIDAQKLIVAHMEEDAKAREAKFVQDRADLLKLKPTAQTTPQQVVERIPQFINFPTAPKMEPETSPITGKLTPERQDMVLVPENQKLLLEKLVDCQVCNIERAKLQADLAGADVKQKATEAQRDAALTEAHGGPFWKRVKSAAKWLVIGAAAGAIAGRMAH